MSKEIFASPQTVKELLEKGKSRLFVIPEYQRPYVWDADKCEKLFNDIWSFAFDPDIDEKTQYFLGTIVSYHREEDDKEIQEIIDGQQRITSLFLLLRAIYTKLSNIKDKNKMVDNFMSQIEQAIWRTSKKTAEPDYTESLLKSNVVSDDANKVLHTILETGETKIGATDNYSLNYNKFIELYEYGSQKSGIAMEEFFHTILNRCILLPVVASDMDSALTIFSTLNDRGQPLSEADIFKAEIYKRLNINKRKSFIESWQELENSCTKKEPMKNLFYYHMIYLKAKSGDYKTSMPGLRNYFIEDNPQYLYDEQIVSKLSTILDFFKVVNERDTLDNQEWSKNNSILTILDCLKDYPNEYWKYPSLIYYIEHHKKAHFQDNFLKFLRKLYVCLISRYIKTPSVNSVKGDVFKLNCEIFNTMHPSFVSFNDIEIDTDDYRKSLQIPHPNIVRMLLKNMAYLKQTKLLPDKWEIEHIFPQDYKGYNFNQNIPDEEIRQKIEQLGNKIPLEKRLNIKASNDYFGRKKQEYAKSQIKVALDLSKSSIVEWNLIDIENRNADVSKDIQKSFKKWLKDYN